MRIADLKVYSKFLSRNKLYTFVSILGFSISMMFIILLGVYIKQELAVEDFQENKDRIYNMTSEKHNGFANPIPAYLKEKIPEIEDFTRLVSKNTTVKTVNTDNVLASTLFADPSFFRIFSFKLVDGSPSSVLESTNSVVVSRSFANKLYPSQNPVGKTLDIDEVTHTITGIMEDIPQNTQFPQLDLVVNYNSIKNYWGENILDEWGNCSFPVYFLAREGTDLSSKAPLVLELFKEDFWLYKDGFAKELYFVSLVDSYFNERGINTGIFEVKNNNKTLIYLYMGISILILVISVLNYINMTIAQSGFRGKEAALKKIMGCSRQMLILQFSWKLFL